MKSFLGRSSTWLVQPAIRELARKLNYHGKKGECKRGRVFYLSWRSFSFSYIRNKFSLPPNNSWFRRRLMLHSEENGVRIGQKFWHWVKLVLETTVVATLFSCSTFIFFAHCFLLLRTRYFSLFSFYLYWFDVVYRNVVLLQDVFKGPLLLCIGFPLEPWWRPSIQSTVFTVYTRRPLLARRHQLDCECFSADWLSQYDEEGKKNQKEMRWTATMKEPDIGR